MPNITAGSFHSFLSYFIPSWNTLKNIPTSYVKIDGFSTCSSISISVPLKIGLTIIATVRVGLVSGYDTHQRMQAALRKITPMSDAERNCFIPILDEMLACLDNPDEVNESVRYFLQWLFYGDRYRLKRFSTLNLFSHDVLELEVIEENIKRNHFKKALEAYLQNSHIVPPSDDEVNPNIFNENLRLIYYKALLLEALRGKNEVRLLKMAKVVSYVNAIIFSSFSAYMMWVFIAAFTASLWWLAIPTALTLVATWYVSIHFGGSAIKSQFAKLGYYLDNPTMPKPTQIFCAIAALSAITTAPLLYVSLANVVIPVLMKIGIAAALANPIGAGIVGAFVVIWVMVSICMVFSQMEKIGKGYHELCGRNSKLRKEYKDKGLYGLFIASIIVGVLFSAAAITIAVAGDVFGFQKVFPVGVLSSYGMKAGFLVMSTIYNTLFNFADTTVGIVKGSLRLFNYVTRDSSREKRTVLNQPALSYAGI